MKLNQRLALALVAASAGIFGMSSAAFADAIAVGTSVGVGSDGTVTDLNTSVAVGPNAAANATLTTKFNGAKVYSATAVGSLNDITVTQGIEPAPGSDPQTVIKTGSDRAGNLDNPNVDNIFGINNEQ